MKKSLLFCAVAAIAATASFSTMAENVTVASVYPGGDTPLIGWGGNSTIEDGLYDNHVAYKITNPAAAANPWEVQIAFDIDFTVGTEYYLTFDIKGDPDAGITSGFQCTDGYIGCGNCTSFPITDSWETVTIQGTVTDPGEGKTVNRWVANLGNYVGTFYISHLICYYKENTTPDPGTPAGWESGIQGGIAADGQTPSIQAGWAGPAEVVANPAGEGVCFAAPIAADPENAWDSQLFIVLNNALEKGTKIKVSFDYYCSDARTIETQAQGNPGAYHHWQCIGVLDAKPEWQKLETEQEVSEQWAGEDGFKTIAFNLASIAPAATFYINNVVVLVPEGTGVEAIESIHPANSAVYNMQGVKVLDNANELNSLPKGIYIVNGKKIAL